MTALFSTQALDVGGQILNKCIPISALEKHGSISTITPTDTSNRDFSLNLGYKMNNLQIKSFPELP